jgi:hypothetical protein
MAERRMFAKTIIDSDAFLDMPTSSQLLYFHLSMRADDEGFINNPKRIQRTIGSSDDDLKILIAKKFIIPFESGVVVIKHWRLHNYIRNDRFKETVYQDEKRQLEIKENGVYTHNVSLGIPDAYQMETQVSIGKDRIGKVRIEKNVYGEFNNVKLSDDEYSKLEEKGLISMIEDLSYYINSKGDKYKSHYATILMWDKKNKMNKPQSKVVEIPDYYNQKDEEVDKAALLRKLNES